MRQRLNLHFTLLSGAERFYRDIELMIGFRPILYWKVLWSFVTPAVIMVSARKIVRRVFTKIMTFLLSGVVVLHLANLPLLRGNLEHFLYIRKVFSVGAMCTLSQSRQKKAVVCTMYSFSSRRFLWKYVFVINLSIRPGTIGGMFRIVSLFYLHVFTKFSRRTSLNICPY